MKDPIRDVLDRAAQAFLSLSINSRYCELGLQIVFNEHMREIMVWLSKKAFSPETLFGSRKLGHWKLSTNILYCTELYGPISLCMAKGRHSCHHLPSIFSGRAAQPFWACDPLK